MFNVMNFVPQFFNKLFCTRLSSLYRNLLDLFSTTICFENLKGKSTTFHVDV